MVHPKGQLRGDQGVTKGTTKGLPGGKVKGYASESAEPHMPLASNCACILYNDAWPPHRPIIHTPTSTYIPLDVYYTPIATQLCMVACADLPLDLKYAVWAESKEWASSQWPLSVVEGPISNMMV